MNSVFFGFGKKPHAFFKSVLVIIIAVTFLASENYRENDVIKKGLSAESILWTLSDGTLLGVYEPTATLVKLLIVSCENNYDAGNQRCYQNFCSGSALGATLMFAADIICDTSLISCSNLQCA